MSVESIVQKIKQDADDKATQIREEAARDKKEIEKSTERMKNDLKLTADIRLQKAKEKLETVTISGAKQDLNLKLQTVKRELLNEVTEEALNKLYAVSPEEYQAILLPAAQKEITDPTLIISVESPEKRKEETETVLKALGCTAPVTYLADMPAGLRLVGKDFVIDLTFPSLFANRMDEIAISAAGELFATA